MSNEPPDEPLKVLGPDWQLDDEDHAGRSPRECIGRRCLDPPGVVIGGYVDACEVLMLDVQGDDGRFYDNVALIYLAP